MDAGGGTLRVPPPSSTSFPKRGKTPQRQGFAGLTALFALRAEAPPTLKCGSKGSCPTARFHGRWRFEPCFWAPAGPPPQAYDRIRPTAQPSMPPYGGRGVDWVCRGVLAPFCQAWGGAVAGDPRHLPHGEETTSKPPAATWAVCRGSKT